MARPFALKILEQEPPKQWLPGFVRWPIRVVLLPFVLLDLAVQRLLRVFAPLPYKIEGGCDKRGDCCRYILVPTPALLRPIRGLADFYVTQVLGFYPRDFAVHDPGVGEAIVYGCRYLRADGKCAHYRLRPTVCRQWPPEQYSAIPTLLPGCGYRITPRK